MSGPVWRQRDFGMLWSGQIVSEIGSQVTVLALPTLAIFGFHAGPAAVGLLVASERIPFPVLALGAGAIVDRVRKQRLMLVCNLARAAILGAIPALAAAGVLQLWHLFVAAMAMGVFSVFFDLAYLAYVPMLVRADQLLEANSRLRGDLVGGALAGPGLGGLLVQAVGAARAVLADAASFLVSTARCWPSATGNRRLAATRAGATCSARSARDCATSSATRCCAPNCSASRSPVCSRTRTRRRCSSLHTAACTSARGCSAR